MAEPGARHLGELRLLGVLLLGADAIRGDHVLVVVDRHVVALGHLLLRERQHEVRGERIAAVYVTTLQRTQQTAAPLLTRLGMEARVEPDLREVFLGDWEGGLLRQKVADQDPIAVQMYAEQRWDVIPNGEPADAFESRVRAGIERIAAAHRGELQPRTAEKIFHTRVEGQFRKIIRHGTAPANYWWEVFDKNGTRFIYGGDPATNLPTTNSTLVDAKGNVFF